jgi:DNA-binding CsgD family transcriptional regulator
MPSVPQLPGAVRADEPLAWAGDDLPLCDLPRSELIDEDPRDTIARLLHEEEARQRRRREDLATMRNALARLHDLDVPREVPPVAPITVELAPTLLRSLNEQTNGPVRNVVLTTSVGSGVAPELVASSHAAIRRGLEQRTIYDDRLLTDPAGRAWITEWAAVGERQRVLSDAPSEFAIYGDSAVVAVGTWGDVSAEYVVVRDPMLVQLFIALFDRMWEQAAPVPTSRTGDEGEDDHLLSMLARGLKDEAIARYLGWSLRTVRRRVARLMDELGARTRFQLGAEAVRAGRLAGPEPSRSAGAPLARPVPAGPAARQPHELGSCERGG